MRLVAIVVSRPTISAFTLRNCEHYLLASTPIQPARSASVTVADVSTNRLGQTARAARGSAHTEQETRTVSPQLKNGA